MQGASGDGARIGLKAGQDGTGDLILNSTAFLSQANATGTDQNGGSLELSAGTIFAPAPLNLEAMGTGTGDGGSITLTVRAASSRNVGTGGDFTFNASAPGSGNGGLITANFGGDVALSSGGIIGSGGGNGGSAVINANGNITYFFGGINVQGGNGDGAVLSLNAGQDGVGSIILDATDFLGQANATGANGNGGVINLTAPTSIVFDSSLAAPLVLSANGVGNGDGGFVSYRTNNIAQTFIVDPLSVIKAPKPPVTFLQISAKSGAAGGHGGGIDVSVGGILTVDPLFMTAGPQASAGNWDGALYSLQSGTGSAKGGALIINGSLNANGVNAGLGGAIALSSRVSSAFSVNSGVASKNGITGTLSATGSTGFIFINNGLGNVTVAQNGAMTADSIMLSTGSKGSITTAAGVQINAGTDLTLVAAGTGSIGGKSLISVNTPDLVAQSNGTVGAFGQFFVNS